jgi:DNA repair protein RecO (recombination protein O)
MRTHAANAVVLRRIDLGEKDRILTLYTKEQGKLSAVAKGARRPGSRLAGASEPFTYLKLLLATGRDLDIVSQAEIKESFPNVKSQVTSVAYGIYILELVSQFVDERQPNADLFDTLLSSMYVLESGVDPEITTRYFELQLLSALGYEPHFDACLRCARQIGREKVAFSPSLGGVVCQKCGTAPNDAIWVPGAAVSYVRALRQAQPQTLKQLNVPTGARRDLECMLKWHIRYRLERDLKSVEFIRVADSAAQPCEFGSSGRDEGNQS